MAQPLVGNTVTSEEAMVLEEMFRPGYPDTMREIALCAYQELMGAYRNAPFNPKRCARLANLAINITNRIGADMGGGNRYINKLMRIHLTDRNLEMCKKFNGRNYLTLAKQYSLTDVQVRNIIKAYQQREYLEKQLSLVP